MSVEQKEEGPRAKPTLVISTAPFTQLDDTTKNLSVWEKSKHIHQEWSPEQKAREGGVEESCEAPAHRSGSAGHTVAGRHHGSRGELQDAAPLLKSTLHPSPAVFRL